MITTVAKLHGHVDRQATLARLDGVEGQLHTFGSGQVSLHETERPGVGRRITIDAGSLARLEVRTLGPDGAFVPLAEFDEVEAEATMARVIARSSFRRRLDAARTAIEDLRASFADLHADDAEVAGEAYGKAQQVDLASSGDLEWPRI